MIELTAARGYHAVGQSEEQLQVRQEETTGEEERSHATLIVNETTSAPAVTPEDDPHPSRGACTSRLGHQEQLLVSFLGLSFLIALSVAIGGQWAFGNLFFSSPNIDGSRAPTLAPSFIHPQRPTPSLAPIHVPDYFPICAPPSTLGRRRNVTGTTAANGTKSVEILHLLYSEEHMDLNDAFRNHTDKIFMSGDASVIMVPRTVYPDDESSTDHRGIIRTYAWPCEDGEGQGYKLWGRQVVEGQKMWEYLDTAIALDRTGETMAVLSKTHVRVHRRTPSGWKHIQDIPIKGDKNGISMTEDGLWFGILNYDYPGKYTMWLDQVSRADGEMIPYELIYDYTGECREWMGLGRVPQVSLTTISDDSVEALVFQEGMGARLLQYQHGSTTTLGWTDIDSTEANAFFNVSGLYPLCCQLNLGFRVSHRQLTSCSDLVGSPDSCNQMTEGCVVKEFVMGKGWIEVASLPTAYRHVQVASNGAVAILQKPFRYHDKETTPKVLLLLRQSQKLEVDSATGHDAVWEHHDAYPLNQLDWYDHQMLLSYDGTKVLVATSTTRENCRETLSSIALYQLP